MIAAPIMESSLTNRAPIAEEFVRRLSAASVVRAKEPLAKKTTLRSGPGMA